MKMSVEVDSGFKYCPRCGLTSKVQHYLSDTKEYLCPGCYGQERGYRAAGMSIHIAEPVVLEIMKASKNRKHTAWYLYGHAVNPHGGESARWVADLSVRCPSDAAGRPMLNSGTMLAEVVHASKERECLATLFTVRTVSDPPSEHNRTIIGRALTDVVCLMESDGTGNVHSYMKRDGRLTEIVAVV